MQKIEKARESVNREKQHMLAKGTTYRKKTAIYSSRILNDLVSSNSSHKLTRSELKQLALAKFHVNEERATDVAKSIDVHLKSVDDQDRLAKYYQTANELLQNR